MEVVLRERFLTVSDVGKREIENNQQQLVDSSSASSFDKYL